MDQRRLYKLDAGFEATLGVVLVVGAGSGRLTGADFPHPIGRGILVGAGVALGLLAVALLLLARAGRERGPLLALMLANDGTGLAAVLWLFAAHGFSPAGEAIVSSAIVGLLALSTLQLRALMIARKRSAAA